MHYKINVRKKGYFLNIAPVTRYNYPTNLQLPPKKQTFGGKKEIPQSSNVENKESKKVTLTQFFSIPKIKMSPQNGKFFLQDYKKLSSLEKSFIDANIPTEIKKLAAINVEIGTIFKKAFDEKYGSGNYKFISLGTSPACIAKVLELMGVDVVYLPMSYSHSTCTKQWLKKSPYIDFYKSYMKEMGLSNENLKKEGKQGIICDYTVSGRSLELSLFMLKEPLGLDENLLETYTVNDLIQNSEFLSDEVKEKYLSELLRKEKAADFCDVPHFSFLDNKLFNSGKINSSKSLIKYFRNYRGKSSNAYNFSVMQILENQGKLS